MVLTLMLANPVFWHCLLQLLDSGGEGIEQLLLHGLLDGFVDETGSSTANLAGSNQSVWICLSKGQILLKVDSDILTWSLMAMRGILALQRSIARHFFSLEKCLFIHGCDQLANAIWVLALYSVPRWYFIALNGEIWHGTSQ
jgi:hypothetical protein